MKQKKAFTLVELLVVVAILIMMATVMIGVLNAIGITNKGRDAQRKKDLNRIKVAFEEYFNDKGEFPFDYANWNIKSNCKSSVFAPYLNSWPCDPNGQPYNIYVEINKFRIITNLENKKDKDIPNGWYIKRDFNMPILGLNVDTANYGVSSANILWYEGLVRDYSACYTNTCFNTDCRDRTDGQWDEGGGCSSNCYYQAKDGGCTQECSVNCCGDGCN